jgi:YebC/PmpR family DNA-binding regulatory protein
MGRIFERRKTTMFARWDRMAKQFSRASKEITIAAKRGIPDPAANPALRRAVQNARAVNMPKEKIEAAIRRATGHDAVEYQEVLYEGYGPHGVAILVEAATDNPTRTVANVRRIFHEHGGNLGATGSVAFQFKRIGVFRLGAEGIDADDLELAMIDHGLEEMRESEGEKGERQLVLRSSFHDLGNLQRALEERGLKTASSGYEYACAAHVELPEEQAKEVLELIDALEQDDDVQRVSHTLA